MPTKYVTPPARSGFSAVGVLAAVLLFAAGVAVAAGLDARVTVTVDGVRTAVPAETTVRDLTRSGAVRASAGDLIAVDGSLARAGGGDAPRVTRNGHAVRGSQRVYDGDVLVSVRGADRRERLVTVTEPIAQGSHVEGSGPVMRITSQGRPGQRSVTEGAVSRIEVSSLVVRQPVDMVITRSKPRPTDKLIALTFDDGPWPGQTDRILEILAREHVSATFFMLGGRVKLAPSLAASVSAQGHLVGDHTLGHALLTAVPPAEVRRQMALGQIAVRDATGVLPQWFRPPYGAMDSDVWNVARLLKLKVALWDIDSRDWSKPGVERIVGTVVGQARPGAIVLMHDGGGDRSQTIAALPRIITLLKARGYVFVTLDDL